MFVSLTCIYCTVCMYLHATRCNHTFLLLTENNIYHELSVMRSNKRDIAAALIDREEIEVSHETC